MMEKTFEAEQLGVVIDQGKGSPTLKSGAIKFSFWPPKSKSKRGAKFHNSRKTRPEFFPFLESKPTDLHHQKWPPLVLHKMTRNKSLLPEIPIAFGLVILRTKAQSKSCERPLLA
jgi:hypothetical protein